MLRLPALALVLPFVLSLATSASATTFSFHCIAGGGGGGCAIPIDELWVEVTSGPGSGEVSFTFHNEDGASIVAIYFDDPSDLLDDPSIDDGSGVDFDEGGSPGNLPSGNVAGFDANWVFTADNPQKKNGVNAGEEVTITFEANFADVIDALEDGDLRVGLHAPGFDNRGNKSFVNETQGVPEPGLLTLLALGAAVEIARRR